MTPIINKENKSIHLPTNPLNKSYNIEFNEYGEYKNYRIDYEAMTAHIALLHQETKRLGYDIWRVIFDPKPQDGLFKAQYKTHLKSKIHFPKKDHGLGTTNTIT